MATDMVPDTPHPLSPHSIKCSKNKRGIRVKRNGKMPKKIKGLRNIKNGKIIVFASPHKIVKQDRLSNQFGLD